MNRRTSSFGVSRFPLRAGTWSPPLAMIASDVDRRVRMASAVAVAPSMSKRSGSAGIAAISFDLASTRTWPGTRFAPTANA